jgi:ATP-binding cassette subfamily F protein 3
MDEPTNHLDIQSKEIIKIALQKFEGTVIVISHDREFLQGLCDKIFEFRDGAMKEFLGNINEYLEYRQKESIREISIEKSKLSQEIVEVKAEKETSVEDKPSNTSHFVSKEQKNLQNKLKKLKKKFLIMKLKLLRWKVFFLKPILRLKN